VLGMVMKSDKVQSVGETPGTVGSIGEEDDDVGFGIGVGDGDVKVEDDVDGTDEGTCFVS
jgi:hypothetical protein